jgi:hypothetical protein
MSTLRLRFSRYFRLARKYGLREMVRKGPAKVITHIRWLARVNSPRLLRLLARLISAILCFPLCRIAYLFAMDSRSVPEALKNRLGREVRRTVIHYPSLSKSLRTGKALIVYHSKTGNTEKVAAAITRGITAGGLKPIVRKASEAIGEELYDYDLVCLGTPVIHSLPPPPVMRYILKKGNEYRKRKEVRLAAPRIPGKDALVFVTFSGPHTGKNEALPAGKYLRQFLEHLGFDVKGEWYVVGEFHSWQEASIRGKMGDIRGRPNAQDLAGIEERTVRLVESLQGAP